MTIPRGATFEPLVNAVERADRLPGGVEPGLADRYALELDSPTAVRTLNRLIADGMAAEVALGAFTSVTGHTLAAGSAVFPADPATLARLGMTGRDAGVTFRRVSGGALPALEPIERVPRIAVLLAPSTRACGRCATSASRPIPFRSGRSTTRRGSARRLRPRVEHGQLAELGEPDGARPVDRVLPGGGGYLGAGSAAPTS